MMSSRKVAVTGASGLVGSNLVEVLNKVCFEVLELGRTRLSRASQFLECDLSHSKALSIDLKGIDTFIHCAALTQAPQSKNGAFRAKLRELNVNSVVKLAKMAKKAKVRRFIFLSSVKAMGESTLPESPYTNKDECSPEDLYGESKLDAELALKNELACSDTELVIIRPPLIYGPGVKGNFKVLMGLAKKNLPLPFGSVANKRSFVSIDSLISLIVTCVKHFEPLNDTFLVSDGHDVSTKELFEALTKAYGKEPKLWPCPVGLMRFGATILGKKAIADRLFGNLQLDITHTKKTLNWEPPVSFQQAIQTCVKHELNSSNNPDSQ